MMPTRYDDIWTAAIGAVAAQASSEVPKAAASSSPVPDSTTRHRASRSVGISSLPALMIARTGVTPVTPIIFSTPISAPTQWDRSMISWVAQPGMKYLLPPEMPTTSWGNTGPMTVSYTHLTLPTNREV